jgi:hypothetical protein
VEGFSVWGRFVRSGVREGRGESVVFLGGVWLVMYVVLVLL